MTGLLIGCIIGPVIGVFIGANVSPDTINHIGKIKRNNAPVDINQAQQKERKGIKGFIKGIFTKKK